MRTTLFGAVAAISLGTIAIAQPAPPSANARGGDRGAWMQAHAADFARMRQRRADDIALLIGLTPAQRPAFDAMLAAMEPPHRDWGKDGGKPPMGPGAADEGTIARLDHMSAKIDERGASAKAKLATLRTFYAGLTPDQKLRFDALDRLRHDHGGMHDGMRGGPGGRGPEMGAPPRG